MPYTPTFSPATRLRLPPLSTAPVGDTVLQKTPFSFDVSVWEFFWPLMSGARLVVAAPGDHRDPAKLVALINREGVDTLHFVPSMLQAFLQDEDVVSCTSLKRIVCSGEALPADAQQQVFAKLPQAGLYNLYGPTEAAIDVRRWPPRSGHRGYRGRPAAAWRTPAAARPPAVPRRCKRCVSGWCRRRRRHPAGTPAASTARSAAYRPPRD